MKQEEKDLLLKDLCARLPYRVKVKVTPVPELEHLTYDAKLFNININNFFDVIADDNVKIHTNNIEEIKPYLFPLSSMTEEQSKTYHELIGGMFGTNAIINFEVLEDFFHKNHLDYRGLIPMGLAVDATNLNIY